MTRLVNISSALGAMDLAGNVRLGRKVKGTGMPPVSVQWFEGAGEGAQYRGARTLRRPMDLPIKIYGNDRSKVEDQYRKLATIFSPAAGPVRLTMTLDGAAWYADVVRVGGGDFDWDSDTDGVSYLYTVLSVEAGDPYWTRLDSSSKPVTLGGLGRGLIQKGSYAFASLALMRVSTTASFGTVVFDNPGDVPAFAVWRVTGPFTSFKLTSPDGLSVVEYVGVKSAGQWVEVNMAEGTAIDNTGANVYASLTSLPAFWAIPPGSSSGSVLMPGATSASSAVALWNPKKWILF